MDIILQNISKQYGRLQVLRNLDLVFPDGQLTALLGPSGCGKTTILNLIAGVLQPDQGDVYFADRCMTHVHLSQRNIGYVFQNYALYPNMRAYDNLLFPLSNRPDPTMTKAQYREFCDQQIHQVAQLLKIEDTLSRYPSELSGGQQQRVALGRAIIRQPDILLMDEPFANLDRKLSVQMREEVRQIQQQTGITTIFVTHNQADANAISDQIVLLNNGTVQQAGTPSELYDRPSNLFTADFFGEYGANILPLAELAACCPDLISCPPPAAVHGVCRPEDVSFDGISGPFTVTGVTRIGGSYLHQLQCGDLRLQAITAVQSAPGTAVRPSIRQDKLGFYDAQGTRLTGSEV